MNNNNNSGKGFLKDKLVGYQQDPPPEVWESISARLSGRGGRRKVIIILSAAASLALAVTLGITYMGRDLPGDRQLTSSPKPQESKLEERVVEVLAKVQTPVAEENSPVLAAELSREEPPLEEHIHFPKASRTSSCLGSTAIPDSNGHPGNPLQISGRCPGDPARQASVLPL